MKRWLSITVALFAAAYMFVFVIAETASGDKRGKTSGTSQKSVKTDKTKTSDISTASLTPDENQVHSLQKLAARSPNFNVDWYSVNSGGDITAASANFASGVSVAQSAAGEASSANFQLDVGFWYGVGASCCKNAGDANDNGAVNIADVTFLIARIFAGGAAPPCCEQADANGNGSVNIADVTFLIARIFAGGPPPICGPSGLAC